MSSYCRAAQRQRAHCAAATIEADPRVLEVTAVEPSADPTGKWLLDIVLGPETAGLPTGLFDPLAFELSIRDLAPQGEHWIARADLSTP